MKKFATFCLLLFVVACKKEESPKQNIEVFLPKNFPAPTYDLSKNPVTEAGFALGKRLFYDPILSRDSSIACADCHISFSAFSHPDHATSHGIDGKFGKRNAPAAQNLLWRSTFFWDGGVPNLDLVPLNAIQNPVEMDEIPANVVKKLNKNTTYRDLFRAAFPTRDTIDGVQMLQAMSQFMAMLVTANSRYDRFVRGESGGNLTTAEQEGLAIFKLKCAACHSTDLFTDQSFRNNGILDEFSHDRGRAEISQLPDDVGKFKVPSLRNVAVTSPYMHNGKYKKLEDVLRHYASEVKDSPTLDPLLRQADGTLGISLTSDEQARLVDFLKTLTDTEFLKDARFQKD